MSQNSVKNKQLKMKARSNKNQQSKQIKDDQLKMIRYNPIPKNRGSQAFQALIKHYYYTKTLRRGIIIIPKIPNIATKVHLVANKNTIALPITHSYTPRWYDRKNRFPNNLDRIIDDQESKDKVVTEYNINIISLHHTRKDSQTISRSETRTIKTIGKLIELILPHADVSLIMKVAEQDSNNLTERSEECLIPKFDPQWMDELE